MPTVRSQLQIAVRNFDVAFHACDTRRSFFVGIRHDRQARAFNRYVLRGANAEREVCFRVEVNIQHTLLQFNVTAFAVDGVSGVIAPHVDATTDAFKQDLSARGYDSRKFRGQIQRCVFHGDRANAGGYNDFLVIT